MASAERASAGAKGRLSRARGLLRRHERLLATAYLAAVVAVLLVWLLPGVRASVSDQARRFSGWSDRQWVARVDRALALLAEGRSEEAEAALVRLDQRLPARHIKHGLATERARVLEGLARSHWQEGRKRRALETLGRLTAFEPRNFAFHSLHAEAALAFGELDLAREAWGRALAIHPNHLDTVRRVVQDHADRGDAAGAVAAFERYLDAHGSVQLWLQGEPLPVYVLADAASHALEIPVAGVALPLAPQQLTSLVPLEVAELRAVAAATAGSEAHAERPLRVHARLRAFKPVDPELWSVVRRACRNLLDWDRLARLEARTRPRQDPPDAFAGEEG